MIAVAAIAVGIFGFGFLLGRLEGRWEIRHHVDPVFHIDELARKDRRIAELEEQVRTVCHQRNKAMETVRRLRDVAGR